MKLRSSLLHEALSVDARVRRFVVHEGLSRLFDIEVEIATPQHDLDLGSLLDKPALLELTEEETCLDSRQFHGWIEEAEWIGNLDIDLLSVYRLRLRPKLHDLSYEVRSRLFQDVDVIAVVKEVFSKAGLVDGKDVIWRTKRTYATRDLCTQYRESTLAFVLRLLEDEGIFFWFEHSDSGHVLVLADDPSVHQPMTGEPALGYTRVLRHDIDAVTDLVHSSEVAPDSVAMRDWSWERPDVVLARDEREDAVGLRWTEYPGGFTQESHGLRRACDRLQHLDRRQVLTGRSCCRRLTPGAILEIFGASPDSFCRDWLPVELEHRFDERVGAGSGEDQTGYQVRFRALAGDACFRPPRVTPRPRIFGKETATVVGPGSEEIHVDKWGRVKVHFWWDREHGQDDQASCWIRAQQLNTSGNMILPRVGYEVTVGFMDGDPDRPVVLQRMYNQKCMPPQSLPAGKSKGQFQSRTTGGGGGVNALAMDDAGGGMQLGLTASRDLKMAVGHEMTVDVTRNCDETVGNSYSLTVIGNEEVTVQNDQQVSIARDGDFETGKGKTVSVGGADKWEIGGNRLLLCEGNRTDVVSGAMAVTACQGTEVFNGTCQRTVQAMQATAVGLGLQEEVAGNKTEMVAGAQLEILKRGKDELVGGSKSLVTSLVREQVGGDVGITGKAGLVQASTGTISHKAGEDWTLTADTVKILALTGADILVGGSKLKLSPSKLKVKTSEMAGKGATLSLSGNIDYKG